MAETTSKFDRSWELIKASTRVLSDDGELLLLPLLSGLAALGIGWAMVWQATGGAVFGTFHGGDELAFGPGMPGFYVWLFAFYVVEYFVLIFFNTALVGAALMRLEGSDPTLRSALAIAFRHILPILGYAIFSATVGIILKVIGDRGGLIGRLIAGGLGLAWTAVTFLVVPVLVAEGVGPWDAIERSGELLRKTWGENVIGNVGISMAMGLLALPAAAATIGGMYLYSSGTPDGIVLAGVGIVAIIGLSVFSSALGAVYTAAVYYYTVVGEPPVGFDRDLIRDSFGPKPTAE